MATSLLYHWIAAGFESEGRDWLARLLAADGDAGPARAAALCAAARLAVLQCDPEAAAPLLAGPGGSGPRRPAPPAVGGPRRSGRRAVGSVWRENDLV
ncbi:hypothetical protein ACGFZP_17365 [Kitasatospora sp. NPDC048239]|uniref:hypothetical protein n=1 Tax=Kitasatospora sp. NPDC048239 TaxID=3364046 RepID=UPI003719FB2C